MKIVFATHNQNKLKEIQQLVPSTIEIVSLTDINCNEDIAETADTIEGNALLKAKYVKENYGYDCFADDTGLEVTALNGEPGVYSARYAGEAKDDAANVAKILDNLKGKEDRSARFKTVVALVIGQQETLFTGICAGTIMTEKRGEKGFGYDPIFQPEDKTQTFAEMSSEEKGDISHRGKAVKQLIEALSK